MGTSSNVNGGFQDTLTLSLQIDSIVTSVGASSKPIYSLNHSITAGLLLFLLTLNIDCCWECYSSDIAHWDAESTSDLCSIVS